METKILILKITIKTQPEFIWKVLTDEYEFSNCFNGLEINCDRWNIGGAIIFKIKNVSDFDKAIITNLSKNKTLSYHYYKANSKDFMDVSFNITTLDNINSEVVLSGNNFKSNEEYVHTKTAWKGMLDSLKIFLER